MTKKTARQTVTHYRYVCPVDGAQAGIMDRHSDDASDIFGECPQCGRVLTPQPGTTPIPAYHSPYDPR